MQNRIQIDDLGIPHIYGDLHISWQTLFSIYSKQLKDWTWLNYLSKVGDYMWSATFLFFLKAASLSPSKPLKAPRQVRPKQLVEDQFLAEFATDLRGNRSKSGNLFLKPCSCRSKPTFFGPNSCWLSNQSKITYNSDLYILFNSWFLLVNPVTILQTNLGLAMSLGLEH